MTTNSFYAFHIRELKNSRVYQTTDEGIEIYGAYNDGKTEVQSYNFPKSIFSLDEAEKWMGDRNISFKTIEELSTDTKDDGEGKICYRCDELKLDARNTVKTDEGYLRGEVVVTRTGVFKYRTKNGGIQRELRHPEDVFNDDSIKSFKMIPITNGHPREPVDANSARFLSVGQVGENIRRDGNNLLASIIITDGDTVREIEAGKQQLSLGYRVNLIKFDGIYDGEQHELRQINIKGNHLAIVESARAGGIAKIKLDSDAICIDNDVGVESNNYNKDNSMTEEKKTGEQATPVETRDDENQNLKNECDALKKKVGELQLKTDSLEGQCDVLKVQNEKLKSDSTQLKEDDIKKKVGLVISASDLLKEDSDDILKLSDKDIMTKVVSKFNPDFKVDDASEEYIRGAYNAVLSSVNSKGNIKVINNDSTEPEKNLDNSGMIKDLIKRGKNQGVSK